MKTDADDRSYRQPYVFITFAWDFSEEHKPEALRQGGGRHRPGVGGHAYGPGAGRCNCREQRDLG
jgi:hypothetical protein